MTSLPGDDRVSRDLPIEAQEAVHDAVHDALAAGPLPEFGSLDWLQLDEDDPRRLYATQRAAMGWWAATVYGVSIPAPVIEREISRRMKEAAEAVSAATDWRAVANRPTRAQVQRRRDAATSAVYLPAPADLQAAFDRVQGQRDAA